MSATVRTVFGMSSSAAHRLDCYGQVEVDFFKTRLPAPYHREKAPRLGLSMPDERPNGGRTLGAGGYANDIGGARQLSILSAGAITRATPPSAGKRAIAIRVCLERGAPLSSARLLPPVERAATARAATSSPTMVTTRARSKRISAIATVKIRRAIPP